MYSLLGEDLDRPFSKVANAHKSRNFRWFQLFEVEVQGPSQRQRPNSCTEDSDVIKLAGL